MADQPQMAKSPVQSQDEGGQAQARRLDESVMSGKGCDPQDNTQRGMGHGDALMEGVGGGSDASAAAKNSGPAAAGSGGNSNSSTYQYTNHSLI